MGVIFQDFPIILLSSLLLLFFRRPEVLNLFIYLSSWSDSVADLRNYLFIQCPLRLASEWLSLLRSFSVASSLSRSIDNYVQGLLPPPPPQGPPSQAQHHRLFFHKSIVYWLGYPMQSIAFQLYRILLLLSCAQSLNIDTKSVRDNNEWLSSTSLLSCALWVSIELSLPRWVAAVPALIIEIIWLYDKLICIHWRWTWCSWDWTAAVLVVTGHHPPRTSSL